MTNQFMTRSHQPHHPLPGCHTAPHTPHLAMPPAARASQPHLAAAAQGGEGGQLDEALHAAPPLRLLVLLLLLGEPGSVHLRVKRLELWRRKQ